VNLDTLGTTVALQAEIAKLEDKDASVEEQLENLVDKNSKLEAELSTLDNRKYCTRLKLTRRHHMD